jgi:anti-sigma-K factor RskA
MSNDHQYWREQGDLYALGALDGQELQEFETHLASRCAHCEAHVRATSETLTIMPQMLGPITPSGTVKARILDRIASEKAAAAHEPRTNRRRWRIIAGTLAAGIAGAVLAGALVIKRYEPRHTAYTAVVNLLRDPSTRDLPLYGAGPTPEAAGRFLWNESGEGHIFVSHLPAAPEGKMYAVWTIAQGLAPRYVGTITTDATGRGGLHINAARSQQPVETFAVTLEPEGTIAGPSGPMVLVSKQS